MARGSVIKSHPPAAPGGQCRQKQDLAARRDPPSEKGLSLPPSPRNGEKRGGGRNARGWPHVQQLRQVSAAGAHISP